MLIDPAYFTEHAKSGINPVSLSRKVATSTVKKMEFGENGTRMVSFLQKKFTPTEDFEKREMQTLV